MTERGSETYPGYLTVTQTAARLGVHRVTIWKHIKAGDLPTYRTERDSRVRLLAVTDIAAIERVTQERQRVRKDWSGQDWADVLIRAHEQRRPERTAETLSSDIYGEEQAETAPTPRLPTFADLAPTRADREMGTLS